MLKQVLLYGMINKLFLCKMTFRGDNLINIHRKKGMTLLEVIIAVAILGIISIVFLSVFANGFTTIFKMGNKTKAVAEAQKLIDIVCQSKSPNSIQSLCKKTSISNIYVYEKENPKKYCVEDYPIIVNGITYQYSRVTVAVFYSNGNSYVKLTAIVP